MAIAQYLQEAMNKMISEKDREINAATQRCTQEKILPHNTEIDTASNTAISKLQKEFAEKTNLEQQAHNERISALQKEFTEKKNQIVEAGAAEKAEFAKSTISMETAAVIAKYDTNIEKLARQIKDLEE